MTNDRQTKNAASEGTSASHCSQARCECRDPRTVWNGTRNQWICDDCGKPANIGTEHLQSSVETAEELAREIEWQRAETENQARKAGKEAK